MASEGEIHDLSGINRESVIRDLEEKGYAVISDVCSAQDCDTYISQYRDWLSQFEEDDWPFQVESVIQSYDISHFANTWNCRLKAKPVFAKIWETEKLLTSFEGVSVSFPPETERFGIYDYGKDLFLADQSPQRIGLHGYQGAMFLEEASETDYCFRVLSGSHKHFETYYEEFEDNARKSTRDKFNKLGEDEKAWFKEKGCIATKVPVPKGGMVLWDSRTVYDNCRPVKGRPNPDRWRFVVLVSMTPAQWANPGDMEARKKAYKKIMTTDNFPSLGVQVFEASHPPHFSDITSPIGDCLPEVATTKEAKLLSGVEEYDFNDGEPNGPSWENVWK
ncbi:uncharacterized protein LOC124257098 [Haliotis rubra]|uniref:uncharacterized protein LOC124257098 n=1 Tax=Haliotis rubra TaxID=36100 RepID=UPI001EE53D34|nr:uncharacterized protein LOC124257098 [Haliotis rubra]